MRARRLLAAAGTGRGRPAVAADPRDAVLHRHLSQSKEAHSRSSYGAFIKKEHDRCPADRLRILRPLAWST